MQNGDRDPIKVSLLVRISVSHRGASPSEVFIVCAIIWMIVGNYNQPAPINNNAQETRHPHRAAKKAALVIT